ncbi:MAG: GNAT family N-acetyltransferase [Myxococcota bacterium]
MTRIVVRNTRPEDFAAIQALSSLVYPDEPPWTPAYLAMHREAFPEGQLVAVDEDTGGEVVGMAASLIVNWDDYDHLDSYVDMTEEGTFANHDPNGRTLYGAEVMVDPRRRRQGIGAKIYEARRELAQRLGLLRIRAGARLPGYRKHAGEMTAEEYVLRVVRGELDDPTLSFQLRQGFHVLAVVPGYQHADRQSRGYAALIEWLNPEVARPEDYARRDPKFLPRRSA